MPDHPTPTPETVDAFIRRWSQAGAAERANFPQFAIELCELIGAPAPDPTTPDERENAYVFEKSVPLPHGTTGRIDLYRRGCFVLEAKQGSDKIETDAALSAAEEAAGHIRWLRPDYQAPAEVQPMQATLVGATDAPGSSELPGALPARRKWPASLPEQAQAVRAALAAAPEPVNAADIAGIFGRRTTKRVNDVTGLLDILVALGQAYGVGDGRYVGV